MSMHSIANSGSRGRVVFAVAWFSLTASCAVFAAGAPQKSNPSVSTSQADFEQLDADHDGYLTRSGVPDALIKARFSTFDLDHDLRLNRLEFNAARHMDNVAHDQRVPDGEYGRFANNSAFMPHTAPGGGAPNVL
jgi:hypothetical protein